ncbi:MAG: GNAT family N-acetyltransferase [Pseudomonadota bacterium]
MPVRPATAEDWAWINAAAEPIGGARVVSNGVLHTLQDYPALVSSDDTQSLTGFAVYIPQPPECELLAIAAARPGHGAGSQLLDDLEERVLDLGCNSIWLATTNDNLDAIKFYQRRGYRMCQLRPGAFSDVVRLKGLDPNSIVVGNFDIPVRDEIQLEKELTHAHPGESREDNV